MTSSVVRVAVRGDGRVRARTAVHPPIVSYVDLLLSSCALWDARMRRHMHHWHHLSSTLTSTSFVLRNGSVKGAL